MARLLTKRKQKWANQFKPDVVRGVPLMPNAAVEMRYYKRIERLILQMTEETEKAVRDLFKTEAAESYFEAMDASISSQARIITNYLSKRFDAIFVAQSVPISESMVSGADQASSAVAHQSLKQLSGGLSMPTSAITPRMREIIKASTNESARLIKSIPEQYLDGIAGAVDRSITTGNGLRDLVPYIQKHKGITLRRARNIARDQSKKAFSNLSSQRMQDLGIDEYEWLHSGGGKEPRKLHQDYSGKIFKFSDPPIIDERTKERGIPGQAINCGCAMVPVIKYKND